MRVYPIYRFVPIPSPHKFRTLVDVQLYRGALDWWYISLGDRNQSLTFRPMPYMHSFLASARSLV